MKVHLLLFAVFRDIVGTDRRELQLPEGATALDVWAGLRSAHPELAGMERPPLTAINMTYSDPSSKLQDGDDLAFIPPVAGG